MKYLILILSFFALALASCHTKHSDPTQHVAVDSQYHIHFNVTEMKDNRALASYSPTFQTQGFSRLSLKANAKYDTPSQAYALGYLEGFVSAKEILPFYHNQRADWGFKEDEPIPEKLRRFMLHNLMYIRQQVAQNAHKSTYWNHVGVLLRQFDGLVHGYALAFAEGHVEVLLTEFQLFMLNAAGDLENLIPALTQAETTKMKIQDEEPLTDCSALVKVLTGNDNQPTDILAGHTTWRGFQIIWSVYKSVEMTFGNGERRLLTYSSSPGFLSSKDDFYTTTAHKDNNMTAHMVVMETTNSIFNESLYDLLTPESVLCWMRSVVANRMTSNAHDWTNVFSRYNSGTYNNQFMAIDYLKFKVGETIQDNTLWIVEQIPGECTSGDMSSVLREHRYFPSYNIPRFKNIYNRSGYPEAKKHFGDDMDYLKCPRRQIFDREQATVQDLTSFGKVLRFNKYQTDPLSKGDPSKAIASRYDLRTKEQKPHPFGGIDSKITSNSLSRIGAAQIIGGPTHDSQPVFDWTEHEEWKDIRHDKQPSKFDFDWMKADPMF